MEFLSIRVLFLAIQPALVARLGRQPFPITGVHQRILISQQELSILRSTMGPLSRPVGYPFLVDKPIDLKITALATFPSLSSTG